jgi:hypothetical protein
MISDHKDSSHFFVICIMRIYSLSKILGIPLGLAAGYLLYLMFFTYEETHLWQLLSIIIPTVALVIFSGQIDHWYLERHPITLDQPIVDWLAQYDKHYQTLSADQQAELHQRAALYERGRSFEAVAFEEKNDVPFDIRCIIATQVVKMSLHHDDYLMGDMDRIYVYKHPFPSPQHKFLHTYETQVEDGVMIFALDYLLPGLQHPDRFYNICGHGIAEAYTKVYPGADYPSADDLNWSEVESMSGFTKDQIMQVLGYSAIDLLPIYIMYFFTRPDQLRTASPKVYEQIAAIFTSP